MRASAAAAPVPVGPGAQLIGADLSGQDLSGADLRGANLTGADLTGATLVGANLAGASLFRATLTRAHLLSADLTGADLTEVHGQGAILGGAILDDAVLFHADLTDSTLTDATLRRADLRSVRLSGARLRGADLTGAEIRSADLSEADLSGSSVHGADFGNTSLVGAHMRNVNGYDHATWVGVDISDLDLTSAHTLRRFIMDENYLYEFRHASRVNAWVYQVWRLTSDCGRSLTRWSVLTLTVALGFGLLYRTVSLDFGDHETPLSAVYFSVVTLTTLGYGDVIPASLGAQILVLAEVLTGYIMLGGLLSIFATKMGRRAE